MTETGISLTVARDGQGTTIDADEVLIATGRTPNIEGRARRAWDRHLAKGRHRRR
jgi:pyruvate/2-oxoglutarate dehydrogenase complex dihydrolipoamide dehydrogenase (E3) component